MIDPCRPGPDAPRGASGPRQSWADDTHPGIPDGRLRGPHGRVEFRDLEAGSFALPGAVLRLSADTAAFSAPHDDARTFLTGPAVLVAHGEVAVPTPEWSATAATP